MSTVTLAGPAGELEARYEAAAEGAAGIQCVLCHPHPQYGGSMHDSVLDALARVLLRAGVGVLRFNFRGVGGSAGDYDGGAGETDDLLAAGAWLRSSFATDTLWAGGYSFGAWVTWNALARGLDPQRVVLLAPPTGAMTFATAQPGCPVHMVLGDADNFVDPAALAGLPGVTCHAIAGADHFFAGRDRELTATLRSLVGPD